MTEAQAWRKIAKAYGTGEAHNNINYFGLCFALCQVSPHGSALRERMERRLKGYLGRKVWAFEMRADSSLRCMAALWLALDAESDEQPLAPLS